jgi:hypothetical protein
MATSRFIPEIVDAFREAMRLEVQASKEDVKCFVAGQTYRLPRCIQRDPALQEMVQERIVASVDGMYAFFSMCEVMQTYAFLGFFSLAYTQIRC